MTERVDYYFNEDWDIEFTDWDDLRTVRDTDVLKQNFVLIASENTTELIGTQLTATKLSRHRNRLEDAFSKRTSVDYFSIQNVEVDDNEITYDLIIGSDELQAKVYV